MKKKWLILSFVLLVIVYTSQASETLDPMVKLFPDIPSWQKKGNPDIYTPDNLYEYINGAADVFLNFDFQKLATLSYESKNKESVTIDIYKHSDLRNGFGIYAQERPTTNDYIKIGTQGYYEKGILNFYKGKYYVKISSFDINNNEKKKLIQFSNQIAEKLEGPTDFPNIVGVFPKKNLLPNSVQFIAKDFLGHKFLHSAYVAHYQSGTNKFKVFIIELLGKEKAIDMLTAYRNFVEGKGMKVEKFTGGLRFQDPYYKRSGPISLMVKGNYLWGLFSKDKNLAEFYLKEIQKKL